MKKLCLIILIPMYYLFINYSIAMENDVENKSEGDNTEIKIFPVDEPLNAVEVNNAYKADSSKKQKIEESTEKYLSLVSGSTLKDGIKNWAHRANVKLVWKLNRDFYIESDAKYNGDVYQIFHSLSMDLQGSNMMFRYFKGNDVLIVEENK